MIISVQNQKGGIDNGFPIPSTIVDTIPTEDGIVQVESDLLGDAGHLWQSTGCYNWLKVWI